jgi:hypothetical protein
MAMSLVKVFDFTAFDINSGQNKLSPSMATLTVIQRLKMASTVPGTGVEIDPSRLDGNGMIRRALVLTAD